MEDWLEPIIAAGCPNNQYRLTAVCFGKQYEWLVHGINAITLSVYLSLDMIEIEMTETTRGQYREALFICVDTQDNIPAV